jgi:hypothetical protein
MSNPTRVQIQAKRLAALADSLRDFASPEEEDMGQLEPEQPYNQLWNLEQSDRPVPPQDPPGANDHGPKPQRETKRPVFRTVDIRPPRGVRR